MFSFHSTYGFEHLTVASGLVTDDGLSVMADRENNIWITSVRGTSKIINRTLAGYGHQQGLYKNEVAAVLQRASGVMVFGHNGGLTFYGDGYQRLGFRPVPGDLARVMDLAEPSLYPAFDIPESGWVHHLNQISGASYLGRWSHHPF